tara:strand:+ start:1527 stop:1880 length:354 start_codon:yes stop_codon:yes gene_type:complete
MIPLFVSACAHLTPADRVQESENLPDSFTLYGATEATPETWWNSFNSPELDRLVSSALDGNFSIEQAVARIKQASAVVEQTGALRRPSLGYSGDAAISRRRTELGGENRRLTPPRAA